MKNGIRTLTTLKCKVANCFKTYGGFIMKIEDIKSIITSHTIECSMLMPLDWVRKHGDDSELIQAFSLILDIIEDERVKEIAKEYES